MAPACIGGSGGKRSLAARPPRSNRRTLARNELRPPQMFPPPTSGEWQWSPTTRTRLSRGVLQSGLEHIRAPSALLGSAIFRTEELPQRPMEGRQRSHGARPTQSLLSHAVLETASAESDHWMEASISIGRMRNQVVITKRYKKHPATHALFLWNRMRIVQ